MTDKAKPCEGPVNINALKKKFTARSIPLEKDFHDLIDMADAGLSSSQDATKATVEGELPGNPEPASTGIRTQTNVSLPSVWNPSPVATESYVTTHKLQVRTGGGIQASNDGLALCTDATDLLQAWANVSFGVTKRGTSDMGHTAYL